MQIPILRIIALNEVKKKEKEENAAIGHKKKQTLFFW